MSGIPIKTGGWRDKARWRQPCFFSSPRPAVSPKEEAIDSPSQSHQEDGSNAINSQPDAEPTGDRPVWTPNTQPEASETLTVSPDTPTQDRASTLPRHETLLHAIHPASKARCKYRSAPYQRPGAASPSIPAVHPLSLTRHHHTEGAYHSPSPHPTPHTDNLRKPGLPIPPPRPTPRSFRPCTAYEPLSQTRAATQALQLTVRDPPKTRIAHWPRPRLPLSAADPITKRGQDDDQRHSCLERWGHILSRLKDISPIAQAWQDSQRPDQLLELSLRRSAARPPSQPT